MQIHENRSDLKNVDLVVMMFSSPTCSACPQALKILQDSEVPSNVATLKINVDKDPSLASTYHVMSLPAIVFILNGEPVSQLSAGTINASSIKKTVADILAGQNAV